MDVVAHLETPHPPEHVFAWVEALEHYPRWLDIVSRAVPLGDPGDDASVPAWTVDLRGRVGPFSRAKRLRMARTEHVAPRTVAFERDEHDGRSHAPWVLRAEVAPQGEGAVLTMRLHYGGGLFGPVLERVLGDTIERSRPRLLTVLDSGTP